METRTLAEQLKYWQTEQRRLKKLHSTWALKSRDGLNARADKLEKKLVNYRKQAHLSEARYHFNEGNIEEWQAAIHTAQIYGNVTKKMVATTMCYYRSDKELEDKIASLKCQIQWEREAGERRASQNQIAREDEQVQDFIEEWVRGNVPTSTESELTLAVPEIESVPLLTGTSVAHQLAAWYDETESNNGNQPIQ